MAASATLSRAARHLWRACVLTGLCGIGVGLALAATVIVQYFRFRDAMYASVTAVPKRDVACLMGARVYADGSLSPVLRQRAEAALLLLAARPELAIVASGDNNANHEAEAMAAYLADRGVASERIIIDRSGDSTHQTTFNLARRGIRRVVFISQSFHLPRTLQMARDDGLDAIGLAADAVYPQAPSEGPNATTLTWLWRQAREAWLTWLYWVGLYDTFS
jgi:vancomycin permeability regulator SanA